MAILKAVVKKNIFLIYILNGTSNASTKYTQQPAENINPLGDKQ